MMANKDVTVIYNDSQSKLVENVCCDYVNEGGSEASNGYYLWNVTLPTCIIRELKDNGICVCKVAQISLKRLAGVLY